MIASDLVNLVGRWNKQANETEQKELSVRQELGRGICETADGLQGEVKALRQTADCLQGEVRALRQAADELWQILERD